MTRKLVSVSCLLIPMFAMALDSDEAQARHRCCRRSRDCCWNQNFQCAQPVGFQQAQYQQPVAEQPMIQQASFHQGTCCRPVATCCSAQVQGATNGYAPGGYAPQSPPAEQAAPAPPPAEQAPAPAPGT